jgi:hypothetical protein
MNLMKKSALIIGSILLFTGCNNNEKIETPKEIKQMSIKPKKFKGFTVNNETISSLLEKLSIQEKVIYIYKGENFQLEKSNRIITSLKDLENYLKTTEKKKFKIINNNYRTSNMKILKTVDTFSNPFKNNLSFELNGNQKLTLNQILMLISEETGYNLIIKSDVYEKVLTKQLSLNFKTKTIKEFINYIEKALNIYVDVNHVNKELILSQYKTFFYDLPIATSNFKTSAIVKNGNTSSGGASLNTETKFSLDIYKDLEMYLNEILEIEEESNSKVVSNIESDTNNDESVNSFFIQRTINKIVIKVKRDKYELVNKVIADFISNIKTQVDLNMTVYTVTLNDKSEYGINWNFMNELLKNGGSLKATSGKGIISPNDFSGNAPSILSYTQNFSNGLGLSMVLNNIHHFGKIKDINSFSVSTMNNMPITQAITSEESYLKSLTKTVSETNRNDVTFSTETDKVKSGIFLYMHPKVLKNTKEVLLNIIPTFSKLQELKKIQYGPSGEFIQVPSKTEKVFNNNIIIKDNEKIIITGIILNKDNKEYEGLLPVKGNLFTDMLTGQTRKGKQREEIFIVVSAKIK